MTSRDLEHTSHIECDSVYTTSGQPADESTETRRISSYKVLWPSIPRDQSNRHEIDLRKLELSQKVYSQYCQHSCATIRRYEMMFEREMDLAHNNTRCIESKVASLDFGTVKKAPPLLFSVCATYTNMANL